MKDYRQWHDEDNNTFHKETMVAFGDASVNHYMGLDKLLKLTSDVAVEDFNARGFSTKVLKEHNFAILVSRCAFRFHKMPAENQDITVTTWEEKGEPLQFYRQYEITDTATKESLVTGYSTWLLVDPVARRILPIKKFDLRTPVETRLGHDCMEPAKITISENAKLIDERVIRYSDQDSNGHTTNSRYGAFIEDALPKEYLEKGFTDFKINFSKEALLGDKMSLYADFDDEHKKITFMGKTEKGSSFEAELYTK